jgi:PHS family inorganic phosphate transporter-like MFS transporter
MSPRVEPRSRLARWLWRDHPLDFGAGFPETGESHRVFLNAVNNSAFNWLVFIVAASGFLTDAYNLFSSNVILPALSYVYHEETDFQFTFNAITLAASAVGQVVFGIAADVYEMTPNSMNCDRVDFC